MKPSSAETVVIIGALAGAAWLIYKGWGKISAAGAVVGKTLATDLNPASQENIVNRAVNSVVQTVTGDSSATLGTKIYDWLHPDENVLRADMTKEIAVDAPNGWRYYTDGTVIAPNGDYYYKGVLVYSAIGPGATKEQLALHAAVNQIPF